MTAKASVLRSWLLSFFLMIGVSKSPAAAESFPVKVGMHEQEVVRLLGEPERKAILDGKVLRELHQATVPPKYRDAMLVFLYERGNIRVWFRHGSVTDITRAGVSIAR